MNCLICGMALWKGDRYVQVIRVANGKTGRAHAVCFDGDQQWTMEFSREYPDLKSTMPDPTRPAWKVTEVR